MNNGRVWTSIRVTHTVRAWSIAEDLSPTEEQEGYGILGRRPWMLASEYDSQHYMRTLQYIPNPKVRGSALWVAHTMMAKRLEDAPDRAAGAASQDRQAARLRQAPPAARDWLAARQQAWPYHYIEEFWIDT